MKIVLAGIIALTVLGTGCSAIELRRQHTGVNNLHDAVCKTQLVNSGSLWFIGSLYDCRERELFIPYQLWSGAEWTGDKFAPCVHQAGTEFLVNGTDLTFISGPLEYHDRESGKKTKVWSRKKDNRDKEQYKNYNLSSLEFKWWYEDKNGRFVHDHTYVY